MKTVNLTYGTIYLRPKFVFRSQETKDRNSPRPHRIQINGLFTVRSYDSNNFNITDNIAHFAEHYKLYVLPANDHAQGRLCHGMF